jgi:hypothetical protein
MQMFIIYDRDKYKLIRTNKPCSPKSIISRKATLVHVQLACPERTFSSFAAFAIFARDSFFPHIDQICANFSSFLSSDHRAPKLSYNPLQVLSKEKRKIHE